jgi:hypothetical protein
VTTPLPPPDASHAATRAELDTGRPTKVFLDTEFTDFIDCDLISIGMVTEDGRAQFYGERNDFRRDWCKDAVRFNILPMLGGVASLNRTDLRAAIESWLNSVGGTLQFVCDASVDWELLIDLFDGTLPSVVAGCTLLVEPRTSNAFNEAVYKYHSAPGQPWHHALHDACANRAGWLELTDAEHRDKS